MRWLIAILLIVLSFIAGHDIALTQLALDLKFGRVPDGNNGLVMRIRNRRFIELPK